jgi:hypothetical protein
VLYRAYVGESSWTLRTNCIILLVERGRNFVMEAEGLARAIDPGEPIVVNLSDDLSEGTVVDRLPSRSTRHRSSFGPSSPIKIWTLTGSRGLVCRWPASRPARHTCDGTKLRTSNRFPGRSIRIHATSRQLELHPDLIEGILEGRFLLASPPGLAPSPFMPINSAP